MAKKVTDMLKDEHTRAYLGLLGMLEDTTPSHPGYIATGHDQVLASPHYTDERWREGHVIYGKQCKTDDGAYSDRLWQWDWDKADMASTVCKASGIAPNTAHWIEAWLSAYYNRPVTLRYIIGQVNWSSGYPVYYYGWDWA